MPPDVHNGACTQMGAPMIPQHPLAASIYLLKRSCTQNLG